MSMQIPRTPTLDPGVASSAANAAVPGPASATSAGVVSQPVAQISAEPAPQIQKPNADQVKKAIANLQQAAQSAAKNLQFSVDKETGDTVIRVVDSNTNEVIRQIPSEEVLQLAKTLDQMSGLLLKQKA